MKLAISIAVAVSLLAGATFSGAALAAEPAPAPAPTPPYGAPITLEQAKVVVGLVQAEARRRGVVITAAVVDSGGTLVLEERMTGASLVSAETAALKARSAVKWQRPTSSWIPAVETSHGAQLSFPDVYVGNGGDLIVAGGRIVGGIGIGGSGPNELDLSRMAAAALK